MIRTVLMGTPAFALPTFDKLLKGTQLAAVVTQPDRNKDRKGNVIFSPVKSAALEHNIPVYQFEKIRVQGVETLKSLRPDVIITCAYGQILSQEIIDIPRYGILNVHASLLPRYRGSSPLQWALINGDKVTGVTIMKTDVGMDTGAMLAKEKFNIPDDMYIDGLFEKAASVGAELLIKTLPDYIAGKITPVAQNESEATKCRMLKKEDALIDWTMDAEKVRNKIRGMGIRLYLLQRQYVKNIQAGKYRRRWLCRPHRNRKQKNYRLLRKRRCGNKIIAVSQQKQIACRAILKRHKNAQRRSLDE